MKIINPLPPKEFLEECFTYNQDTGDLIWKARPVTHFKAGKKRTAKHICNIWNAHYSYRIAGCKSIPKDGGGCSILVGLNAVVLQSHRIIYTLAVGTIPNGMLVDHRDGNPFNNLLTNLRLANDGQNAFNQKPHKDKVGGLPKGVVKHRKVFHANITRNYEHFYLGTFPTPEAAHQAYCTAAVKYHGEFARFA